MKILSNKREGNKIILEVEEDYGKFSEFVEKAFAEAGKEVRLPGFRPGKAPRKMIEQVLSREAVEAQAAQNLISSLYPSILEAAGIGPVDYPNVKILQQEKEKPIVFKIEVDVYPEVKLGKYKGLKVDKKEAKVGDEDISKVLENIRQRLMQMEKLENPPALDDEFAGKVSRCQTLEELKNDLRESLLKERESQAEGEVKDRLVAAASAEAKADIPKGMVGREIDIMLDELRGSLSRDGLTLEDYLKAIKKEEKLMREELEKSAEMRVRGKVILKAIAEAEGITISKEEMDAEIGNISRAAGQNAEEAGQGLDESARKYIQDYLLRRKALDFIREKAVIKTVEKEKE